MTNGGTERVPANYMGLLRLPLIVVASGPQGCRSIASVHPARAVLEPQASRAPVGAHPGCLGQGLERAVSRRCANPRKSLSTGLMSSVADVV